MCSIASEILHAVRTLSGSIDTLLTSPEDWQASQLHDVLKKKKFLTPDERVQRRETQSRGDLKLHQDDALTKVGGWMKTDTPRDQWTMQDELESLPLAETGPSHARPTATSDFAGSSSHPGQPFMLHPDPWHPARSASYPQVDEATMSNFDREKKRTPPEVAMSTVSDLDHDKKRNKLGYQRVSIACGRSLSIPRVDDSNEMLLELTICRPLPSAEA